MTEANGPHMKASIFPGNWFACKEWSLSIAGPQKTKYLQAFLSTMPNLDWELKQETANQSAKFIDVEVLCLAI